MARYHQSDTPICHGCGREAHGNYCGNCGASMNEKAQLRIKAEYERSSQKQRRREACETLMRYAETDEEAAVLEQIKERI